MKKRREFFVRIGLGFFGIILILMGLSSIYRGNLNYSNYWGGVVFAPIAVFVGILVLIVIVFRWKAFDSMSKDENIGNQRTNKHSSRKKVDDSSS